MDRELNDVCFYDSVELWIRTVLSVKCTCSFPVCSIYLQCCCFIVCVLMFYDSIRMSKVYCIYVHMYKVKGKG